MNILVDKPIGKIRRGNKGKWEKNMINERIKENGKEKEMENTWINK